MKKFAFLSLMLFILLNALQAQINIGGDPVSYNYESRGILDPLIFVQTPPLDMAVIEAEDAQWEAERDAGMIKIGRRFGIEFEVNYDLHNSGVWTCLPDGGKLWRLGVECSGALSINLIFDQYRLPANATVYIFSEDKHDKIGGFTDYNNQADNLFATDVVLSDKIIIEYYQPADAAFDGELRLATIVHGYRGPGEFAKGFGQSASCQRNVICPEGAGWEDQIRSVFALYSGGTELCSGAIINNTANDGTPYALTANHCYTAATNPGNWVFRFHWESPTCTPTTNSTYQTMSGATLKMRTATSTSSTDCCLVQLNQSIPLNYNVYFSGWSRTTTAPPSVVCLHHPRVDIKKITLSSNVSATSQYVQAWRANWPSQSCTEGGSSGSPLFDNNHRIIGQEYGGPACNCNSSSNYDEYGRFGISWDANTVNSLPHLKVFLDPLNLNPTTLDGYDPNGGTTTVDAELLNIIVPEDTYYSIQTISPKVTIKNNGTAAITSATVAYTIDGGSAVSTTWTGTLAAGATTDVTFNAITLTYGSHVFVATVTVADDANPNNNSKTKNYEVVNIDAELLDIIVPKELYARPETITPKITVKNNGTAAITSAKISYIIDENQPVIKNWTGTIYPETTADISFSAIALTGGVHVFTTTVTVEHDNNAENNSKTKNYEVLLPECLPVQNLTIEQNGNEITINWEAPEDTEHIKGYVIYVNETETETVTALSFTLTDAESGDYEFCVVALYDYEWCTESPKECASITFVSIGEVQNNPITIYPNPTNSYIFINGKYIEAIEIYNLQGQLLYVEKGDVRKINVSGYASGTYLIKVSVENGQKVTKQITIMP